MADLSKNKLAKALPKQGLRLYLIQKTGTAATAGGTTALIVQSEGFRPRFIVAGLSSETLTIKGSVDGTNFESAFAPIDVSTGQAAASSDLANGTYEIPDNYGYHFYKFTKSSTSETLILSFVALTYPNS